MTTYQITTDIIEETNEVCWNVTDSDGYTWEGFETLAYAEEFIAEKIEEERNDKARDIFRADLDALMTEMEGWNRDQIRAMKQAMIEGLRKARAMNVND